MGLREVDWIPRCGVLTPQRAKWEICQNRVDFEPYNVKCVKYRLKFRNPFRNRRGFEIDFKIRWEIGLELSKLPEINPPIPNSRKNSLY
jgi:hypothetical protein